MINDRNGIPILDMRGRCPLCNEVEDLEPHRLIPVSRGGSAHGPNVVGLCHRCHGLIHLLIYRDQLAGEYNTLAVIRAHPGVSLAVESGVSAVDLRPEAPRSWGRSRSRRWAGQEAAA